MVTEKVEHDLKVVHPLLVFNFNQTQRSVAAFRILAVVTFFLLFFYWPLGGGAPRAATQYLSRLRLDKFTRCYIGHI